MRNLFYKVCSLIFLGINLVNSEHKAGSLITFQNKEQLDDLGKVFLGWKHDEAGEMITFELEVETLGYVGIGISPSGSMLKSDIFIGGVYPNGSMYSSDYFGIGFTKPKIDDHQDWNLIEASELETIGRTFLKFSRLINTCDEEDYPIGEDTTRVIWALGDSDDIVYHTKNRGSHSLNLIGIPVPDLDLEGLDNWRLTLDMVMPSMDTSYWCTYHKAPVVQSKHQIVAFDSFLEGLPEKTHTHHFILYNCYLPTGSNETLDKVFGNYTVESGFAGGHCHDSDPGAPDLPAGCSEYLFVWAKGGKMMRFPANVGYPIGMGENAGKQLYYKLEIHFDNPEKLDNVRVHTGAQFYYTDKLREKDAGLLAVGHKTQVQITVPPNTENFDIIGHCDAPCTEWGLPQDGINIFNVLLHAHMSGRKLKLRQFRGDVELPWIDYDNHYDFDYQQNKPISLTVLERGDRLIYECSYDSTWNNGSVVVGGISSRQEMCQTFIWYYPFQDDIMSSCFSEFPFQQHLTDFGITEYHKVLVMGENTVIIDEPEYLRGPYRETINKFNWSAEFIDWYRDSRRYSTHQSSCHIRSVGDLDFNTTYPTNMKEYLPENSCTNDPITSPFTDESTTS